MSEIPPQNTSPDAGSYYCYLCCNSTTVRISTQGEPQCSSCGETFVEKLENGVSSANDERNRPFSMDNSSTEDPDQPPWPETDTLHLDDVFGRVFNRASRILNVRPGPSERANFSSMTINRPTLVHIGFPNLHIHRSGSIESEYLQRLANAVLGSSQRGGIRTLGDYAIGDISNLVEQLMQNDPNRLGAPPTSSTFLDNLKPITLEIGSKYINQECSICMEKYKIGDKIRILPCNHFFHADDCIMPWLQQHATCPTCRSNLPTEDGDQNSRNQSRNNESFNMAMSEENI
mmetsp:Transcript_2793/g.4186  ORF Transcript_2793/g.4186 Transcript_2793/m.4186 type:complete len:289 (+) Transcript_2793:83-949(+)